MRPPPFHRPRRALTARRRPLQFAGRQPLPYAPPAAPGARYTSLFCALTRPLARGTVHIGAADARAPPAIDPRYLAHAADLQRVVRAVQCALRLFGAPPLARHVARTLLPPPGALAGGEAGLAEYVRENCGSVYHPVGTTAMMPREDGGVVDPSLKVYGTSNLRVVSACWDLEGDCRWAYAGGF